ncbi:hypothetical protein Ancab_023231 [Ancistrocladus abbreviatus]
MEGKLDSSGVVPVGVMEAVKRTLANVEELKTNFDEFLSLSDPKVLAELPPLQRAQSLLLLAKAVSTLFTVRLRCTGVQPDDHPIKGELDRLSRYQDKLERFVDLSKEPLRPSTTINYQAATRFIEHSLPDLTAEQRQSMRSISKGEGRRIKYLERNVQKKRKYPSSEKQSVRAAAQEFLEKAARELRGENADQKGLLGPLPPEYLDED